MELPKEDSHSHCFHLDENSLQNQIDKKTVTPSESPKHRIDTGTKTKKTNSEEFACHKCGKILASKKSLNRHARIHTKRTRFECKICQKTFSECYLTTHLASHSPKNRFQCDMCEKSFVLESGLKIHRLLHNNNGKPFICDICGKEFAQLRYLKTHTRAYAGKNYFQCEHCPKKFHSDYGLKMHFNSHLKKRFDCDVCEKAFPSSGQLKAHKILHNGGEKFGCDVCGKTFIRLADLKKHILRYAGKTYFECKNCQKKFHRDCDRLSHNCGSFEQLKCDICGKTLPGSAELKAHQLLKHDKEKTLVCHVCGRQFTSMTYLMRHISCYGGRSFDCNKCQIAGFHKVKLKVHLGTHHGEKQFKCYICNKVFLRCRNLRKHRLTHEKEFSCDVCGRKFSQRSELKKHIQIFGQKFFECEKCPKRGFHRVQLKTHLRTTYHGEKGFKCGVCKKAFFKFYQLKVHQLIHDKTFVCDVCGKKFSKAIYLERHGHIYPKDRDIECENCNKMFHTRFHITIHRRTHFEEETLNFIS